MTYDNSSLGSCNATLPGPSLQSLCTAAEYIYFMTALDEALRQNPNISRNCEQIKSIDEPAEEYDFIVVGGGAGGAVVAGRLAEIIGSTVMLIENGTTESAAGQVPAFNEALIGAEIDWNYRTSNESHGCLSTNGSCYWTSARSLGGNTAHNGMVYLRGNPTDYNRWEELGNEGWGYNDVLEYFKQQEDNNNIDEVGYDYHGKGGRLPVGRFPYFTNLGKAFLEASEQSGLGVSNDLNGKDVTGFTMIQATQKDGVRVSSATAFLLPHRNNENLHISLESFATKIILENKTAVGVEYIKDGKLKSVRARKEVIISAGTIRSPQLLLLSGIGPKEHLESHGIPVVLDLRGVGENLHDHVSYGLPFLINEPDTFDNNELVAEEYLKYQTGPMSTIGESYIVGAVCSNKTTPDYPDLQIFVIAHGANCAPGKVGALRSDGKRQVILVVGYVHPKSRGRISLASTNPLDHPIMWCNYLSEESDLNGVIDGIEITLDLVKAKALEEYNFTLSETPVEACSEYTIPSREYWACAIRQGTAPEWHQVGTCKMGPASDNMAVVDSQLRVHGIENLRVADGSIMPEVTSANTATPIMMIGERAADSIKNTWFSSSE